MYIIRDKYTYTETYSISFICILSRPRIRRDLAVESFMFSAFAASSVVSPRAYRLKKISRVLQSSFTNRSSKNIFLSTISGISPAWRNRPGSVSGSTGISRPLRRGKEFARFCAATLRKLPYTPSTP